MGRRKFQECIYNLCEANASRSDKSILRHNPKEYKVCRVETFLKNIGGLYGIGCNMVVRCTTLSQTMGRFIHNSNVTNKLFAIKVKYLVISLKFVAVKIIHVNNVWTVLYRKESNMRLPVGMEQRYSNVNNVECFH